MGKLPRCKTDIYGKSLYFPSQGCCEPKIALKKSFKKILKLKLEACLFCIHLNPCPIPAGFPNLAPDTLGPSPGQGPRSLIAVLQIKSVFTVTVIRVGATSLLGQQLSVTSDCPEPLASNSTGPRDPVKHSQHLRREPGLSCRGFSLDFIT